MKYIAYTNKSFKRTEYYNRLPPDEKRTFDILSHIFHFKVNQFVCEELIDWEKVPDDPIYRYVFPRKEMLFPFDFQTLSQLHQNGLGDSIPNSLSQSLRQKMSPPVPVAEGSVPKLNGKPIQGMYRNFPTIVSLFPNPMAKTCHAYCSYCFRWLLFGDREVQEGFSYQDPQTPIEWLRAHPEVKDALFTGADPLVLNSSVLRKYIEPVLQIDSIEVIRISSKSLAWWPFRFTTDKDAEGLLELFRDVVSSGKHLNFCGHFTHPRELRHPEVKKAISRIQSTGAIIRTQGPIVKGVNDRSEIWSDLWKQQVSMGLIPYYMFIEADHHPSSCFRIPMAEALQIFQDAQKTTSSLARTVRGPVFMYDLHRILLDGVAQINGEKFFVLKSLQSPPGSNAEAMIRFLPYQEDKIDFGDLYRLFNEAE